MANSTKTRYVEHTDLVDRHRRVGGEVWSNVAWMWNWMSNSSESGLSRADAFALFATESLGNNVYKAFDRVSFTALRGALLFAHVGRAWHARGELEAGWDWRAPYKTDLQRVNFESNPFVTDLVASVGSQQRQQPIRRFYSHVNTFFDQLLPQWREAGKPEGEKPEPPHNLKRYSPTTWTGRRIEKEESTLILKTGRGLGEIEVDWPHPKPLSVQLTWKEGQVAVTGSFDDEKQDLPDGFIRRRDPLGDKTVGVDLGEVCIAAAYDGEEPIIFEGETLRQLRAVQNREKRKFSEKLDRKQRGSNRHKKISRAKRRRLKKLRDRIEDYLHKMSTRLVEELWRRGASTIAIGDLTGILDSGDYGEDMNRRLHQWAFRQFAEKIEYKAERYGIKVTSPREAYTSQTCPKCGTAKRSHKNGRAFECSSCGYSAHRDVVGAVNIRQKARGEWHYSIPKGHRARPTGETVSPRGSSEAPQFSLFEQERVGARRATPRMGSPREVEYRPHMDCVLEPPDDVSEG